jgi:hypothetical protein
LQSDFDNIPASISHHFFVDTDSSDPLVAEEVASLDPTVTNPESITQFLTLPPITTRANPPRRTTDPLVDFMKSVMFTSDVNFDVVQQLQERRIQAARDKERSKIEKAKSKYMRLLEQEEERRQREAWALEVAEAGAGKALQRQEVAQAKFLNAWRVNERRRTEPSFAHNNNLCTPTEPPAGRCGKI